MRTVIVPPGEVVAYRDADWRGALVVVESGEIALETPCGRTAHFTSGDLLSFEGLPLARLHNRGDEPVLLTATSRSVR